MPDVKMILKCFDLRQDDCKISDTRSIADFRGTDLRCTENFFLTLTFMGKLFISYETRGVFSHSPLFLFTLSREDLSDISGKSIIFK